MRPNINVPAGPIDFEKLRIHTKGLTIGTLQLIDGCVTTAKLIDGCVTAAKAGADFGFTQNFDGGEIGITEWSFGTWTEKSLDGGSV